MKKYTQILLLALLMIGASDTQAQEWCAAETCCCDETPFYAKFFTGANILQNTEISGNKTTYKTGYIVSGSLGYNACHGFRLEGEYAYRRNAINITHLVGEGSANHGHYQSSSLMANLLWDLPLSSGGCSCWELQPFLGIGIGYDFQKIHACNSRIRFYQKFNHFAWQLKAGVAYPICCNTDLTAEYIYHQSGCHFNNHSIGIGLVYKFDCR